VEPYIKFRLLVAGRAEPLFTTAAIERIADASRGVPRTINILCDTVLVYGFAGELQLIDVDVVNEVIRDQEMFGIFSLET
jgi:type II secretory pathway predicted ATPase ExeA